MRRVAGRWWKLQSQKLQVQTQTLTICRSYSRCPVILALTTSPGGRGAPILPQKKPSNARAAKITGSDVPRPGKNNGKVCIKAAQWMLTLIWFREKQQSFKKKANRKRDLHSKFVYFASSAHLSVPIPTPTKTEKRRQRHQTSRAQSQIPLGQSIRQASHGATPSK